MDYRVRLIPRLHPVDAKGQPGPDAPVFEIAFPEASIQTLRGRAERITGQRSARIIAGDTSCDGAPLC
ncbi:MAG: hypothetical protein DI606_09105 [Sphingobium sp.]|uniref:Uncharacterized protein n=1 Tax=Novosphingobium guangzhouense TaxID=1850347 RepID=A0A2K2G4P5_9SPHN|nr:hypothetical protein A8V01_13155 [Novosphingobium guangzhouense]PZU12438.1 MAG: hypothetical protein DI606_09105 [Sphingobium sp.]